MQWRLISDPAAPAAWNMAVDEALLLEAPRAGPTLRFYAWDRPSLSFGYRQPIPAWIARARALRVPCVRRATGGGTVLHGCDLTYAVTAPRGLSGVPDDMRGSYVWIRDRLVEGLRAIGIEAAAAVGSRRAPRAEICFSAATGVEIEVNGTKLVGSAQRRTRDAFLQHGSVRLGESEELASLSMALFGAELPAPWLTGVAAPELQSALCAAFEAALGRALRPGPLRPAERARALERATLRDEKALLLPALSLRTATTSADRFP